MKYFIAFALTLCLASTLVRSEDSKDRSAYGGAGYGGVVPGASSSGGSQGGGASIAALPCPKNYLFSCQPSLQPAPCSGTSGGHGFGGLGGYSENYPVYALQVPQYVNGFQTY